MFSELINRQTETIQIQTEFFSPFHCFGSPTYTPVIGSLALLRVSQDTDIEIDNIYGIVINTDTKKVGHHQKISTSEVQEVKSTLKNNKSFAAFGVPPFETAST